MFRAVAVSAALFSAVMGEVSLAAAKTQALPCEQGFDLTITVNPVGALESSESSPLGLRVRYSKEERGLASRLQLESATTFNKASCELWQKKNWNLFSRILFENKERERSKLNCRNVASVKYRFGSAPESTTKLCLGDARKDGLSHLFQKFYDGTESLAGY